MADDRKLNANRHAIIMEKREHISITGVTDVLSFDEDSIIADTEMGLLVLKGANLHVSKLNLDDGEVIVDGQIDSLEYNDGQLMKGKSSFLSKLFK